MAANLKMFLRSFFSATLALNFTQVPCVLISANRCDWIPMNDSLLSNKNLSSAAVGPHVSSCVDVTRYVQVLG